MIRFIVFIVLFHFISKTFAKDYESAIAQANIYYQRPPGNKHSTDIPMLHIETLDSKKDVKVLIHGFMANRKHASIVPLKNAYLAKGVDNVFMADWEKAASYNYKISRKLVAKVAMRFANILSEFIIKHQIELEEVHLIGHSLGAHIVGNIGKYFNGTLGRITGLDPALPLFLPESKDSIQQTDAKFVDVIHTDYPVFGDITPRGKADFYPNYGRTPQPGCFHEDLKTLTSCSHYKAVLFYAESIGIPRNFPAIPCSFDKILTKVGSCERAATFSTMMMMGEYIESERANGQYFLTTNPAPPFGQGENSKFYRNLSMVERQDF